MDQNCQVMLEMDSRIPEASGKRIFEICNNLWVKGISGAICASLIQGQIMLPSTHNLSDACFMLKTKAYVH